MTRCATADVTWLTALAPSLVLAVTFLLTSCASSSPATTPASQPTPAQQSTPATAVPTAGKTAATAAPLPIATNIGKANATATVKVGDQTLSFTGGQCYRERGGDVMGINIGQFDGPTYFGFGAGQNPGEYDPQYAVGARSAKSGGQFAGRYELIIAIKYDGKRYSPVPESAKATIASGLDSGEFTGTTEEKGEAIEASFKC